MPNFNDFVAMGYALAGLALAFVVLYFLVVALVLSFFDPKTVVVARYEPPKTASPGVAAWLLERGNLSRAMAAAIVNMAAKGYLKLEQKDGIYSVTQLGPDVCLGLEPEEDALARTLLEEYGWFDFDEPTPDFRKALQAFQTALMDTTYFSRHLFLSIPAWVISGLAVALVLFQGHFLAHADRLTGRVSLSLLTLAFGSFIVAVRTLPDTLQKIASRFPGSTVPKRPWSASDSMTFTLLVAAVGGVAYLAVASTTLAALLTAAFLAVNAIFYHALQGPTAAGRKAIAEINEYKRFLAEVEADRISRMNVCDITPADLTTKHAYAVAFRLDLGWGEQFVGFVANLVERSEVFGEIVQQQQA